MKSQKYNISIFDTFKTRNNKITGEARRQRAIIAHLATERSPELRTRTSIAHIIATRHGILWQNIYSGIFRDLDEVLIPAGVVIEGGRLPLRRGPKALQAEGVPFYELSEAGLLVASSIDELGPSRTKMLELYIRSLPSGSHDYEIMRDGILLLIRFFPSFACKIVNAYVRAYTLGLIECVTPLDIGKLRSVISAEIGLEKELIESFDLLQSDQKETISNFIKLIS
ncbi:MAG TPA: hypothetical protein VFI73_04985 [Candidatus Nitrosopolaris sp.]|nr:hypothetical protein [Candidatus Nitrosopolaris sp.]